METSRRSFLGGLAVLVAAPAIVRAGSLMPVKVVDLYDTRCMLDYQVASDNFILRVDRCSRTLYRPRTMRGSLQVISEKQARALGMPDFAFRLQPTHDVQRHVDICFAYGQLKKLMPEFFNG